MLLKTKEEIKQYVSKVQKDAETFLLKKHNPDYIMISSDYESLNYSLFQLLGACLLDTNLFGYANRITSIIIEDESLLEYFLSSHTKEEIRGHITQELFTTNSKYTEFLIN